MSPNTRLVKLNENHFLLTCCRDNQISKKVRKNVVNGMQILNYYGWPPSSSMTLFLNYWHIIKLHKSQIYLKKIFQILIFKNKTYESIVLVFIWSRSTTPSWQLARIIYNNHYNTLNFWYPDIKLLSFNSWFELSYLHK